MDDSEVADVIPIRREAPPIFRDPPAEPDDLTTIQRDPTNAVPLSVREQHAMWNSWRDRARISVVMIGRDVAGFLGNSLPHIAGGCHQIVYMDTGSSDNSRAIAEMCGAEVYDTIWRQDFARARNEAIEQATGDWVISLDCDEIMPRPMLRRANNVAHLAERDVAFWVELQMTQRVMTPEGPRDMPGEVNAQLRMFPRVVNGKPSHWHFPIHEQVIDSMETAGLSDILISGVSFQHIGYHDQNLNRAKVSRNREIMLRELERGNERCSVCGIVPERPRYVLWYHMSKCAGALGYMNEALDYVAKCARDADCRATAGKNDHQLMAAYRHWADLLITTQQPEKALRVFDEAREIMPDNAVFAARRGWLLRRMGQRQAARAELLKAAEMEWHLSFSALPIVGMAAEMMDDIAGTYHDEAFDAGVTEDQRKALLYEEEVWRRKAELVRRENRVGEAMAGS